MKALTNEACAQWLDARSIVADPYCRPPTPARSYRQYPLPSSLEKIFYLVRQLVALGEPFEEALLHITDWSSYRPDDMAVFIALRAAHGETRRLIDTPGHLFPFSGRELLIELLALATGYGWSAYLYFDHHATCLSWEGALLDLWTADDDLLDGVEQLFQPGEPPAAG